MDRVRMMMELELLKRSLENQHYITMRKIEDIFQELKESGADGE